MYLQINPTSHLHITLHFYNIYVFLANWYQNVNIITHFDKGNRKRDQIIYSKPVEVVSSSAKAELVSEKKNAAMEQMIAGTTQMRN